MDISALLQSLQAGGNVAMMAIAIALWRFDRRLFAVELTLKTHIEDEE